MYAPATGACTADTVIITHGRFSKPPTKIWSTYDHEKKLSPSSSQNCLAHCKHKIGGREERERERGRGRERERERE